MGQFNQNLFGGQIFGPAVPAPAQPGIQAQPGIPALLVSDLIYAGYRIAGILAEAGRGYSGSEARDGLAVLNSMLDHWKAQRHMVYATLRSTWTIKAGQQVYQIGTAAGTDFNAERPEKIEAAGFLFTDYTPQIEQPLRLLEPQEWESLSPKGLQSNVPYMLYYEPFVPNGKISVWPIPTSNWQIALYTWQTVNRFSATTTQVILPPGYQEAIEYNLARRLASRYPNRAHMDPESITFAEAALRSIRAINAPNLLMEAEPGGLAYHQSRGKWDIRSNSWR